MRIKIVGANEPFESLVGKYIDTDLNILDLATYEFFLDGKKFTIWPYTWVYANSCMEMEGWACDFKDSYGRLTLKIDLNGNTAEDTQ